MYELELNSPAYTEGYGQKNGMVLEAQKMTETVGRSPTNCCNQLLDFHNGIVPTRVLTDEIA